MAASVPSTPIASTSSRRGLGDETSHTDRSENAMLRNEITLLTDEIGSLTTKLRMQQDAVAEARRQQAVAEKSEKQRQAELKEAARREAEIVARLQVAERDVGSLRSRNAELDTALRKMEADRKAAIQGMSMNSEAHVSAITAAKGLRWYCFVILTQTVQRKAPKRPQHCRSKLRGTTKRRPRSLHSLTHCVHIRCKAIKLSSRCSSRLMRPEVCCKLFNVIIQREPRRTAALSDQLAASRTAKAAHDTLQREFNEYKQRAAKILQVLDTWAHEVRRIDAVLSPKRRSSAICVLQLGCLQPTTASTLRNSRVNGT